MTLILSAHYANRTAISVGNVDAGIVRDVGELQIISQQILLFGTTMRFQGVDPETMGKLARAIGELDEVRMRIVNGPNLPDDLREALFSDPLNLNGTLTLFVKAARGLETSLREGVAVDFAMTPVINIGKHELPEKMDAFLQLFAEQSQRSTSTLQSLQTVILGVALVVLLLQALFVFLPAHLIVTRALAELRNRAEDLRQKKVQLSRAAKLDSLTNLPNRTYLIEILSKALQRQSDEFHVLHIDIDRFRAINDASGDATGDLLLKHVAQLLRGAIPKTDLVARTGGDEFVVVTRQNPAKLAEALCRKFDRPIQLAGRICQTGLSIGYTSRDANAVDAMSLLSNSELALKHAKSQGRGGVAAYAPKLRAALADRDLLLSEISPALDDGQIMPFYQPQTSLATGMLSGVEVLARWIHPNRGMIPPDDFLPLAASEGLARDLDFIVWDRAMAQLVRWRKAGLAVPRISLNAAPDTIADPQVVAHIIDRLNHHGLAPDDIAIEVLETTFIGSIFDMAAINIDRLIAAGVIVELDDFGTGYTSLSTLIQLNLSAIKLDRSLIQPLPSQRAESILRAVMALANEMRLHVVAEGIETPEQSEYLARIGCQTGQGYGIGKPMTARDFTKWAEQTHLWIMPRGRNLARRA